MRDCSATAAVLPKPRRKGTSSSVNYPEPSGSAGLLGGLGPASERARVAVTRAVRYAMSRIGQHDPPLGEHLSRAIRTGTYCVHLPDSRITASRMT